MLELALGAWRGEQVIINPDARCAGTYVNDAFGPNQAARRRARARSGPPSAPQNVSFIVVQDDSGFPYAFWKVLHPIAPGAQLLGDYSASYWAGDDGPEEDGAASARSLVNTEVCLVESPTRTIRVCFVRE